MRNQILLLLILGTLVVACGDDPTTEPLMPRDEVVTITFACKDYQRAEYQELAQEFQADNPDVQVQFVSSDEASGLQQQGSTVTSDGNEVQRLAAAVDAFVWYASLAPADWPYLLDLGPFVSDPSFPASDLYPGTLDHFRWQGGTYGLPAEVLPYLIFYDRSIFDAAGIPYPQPGWTWDDLIAAASQLTETEGGTVSRYGFVDGNPASTVVAMAQQYGVSLWDEGVDPPQPLFDTPPVAEVVRRYVDLARVYQVMPEPEIGSNLLTSSLINEGRAAIWTSPAYERDRHAARTNLGLLPFPEDVAAANPISLYGFFISAGTAHPEATWRWISYVSAYHQPLLPGALPGRRSVGEQLSWWRQLNEDTRTVYEHALDHPAANDPLARPLWSAVAAVFSDDATLEQALANAQEWALNMQADLAQAAPVAPQPVASVQPTPAAGQTVIRFAPAPGADHDVYRALVTAFRDEKPGIWVEIVPSPSDPAELPRAADCFAATAQVAQGTQPELLSLDPLLSADPGLDLADFYPQFLAPVQERGELWALPYDADALVVYLNLDLLTAADVALPAMGWTMDDLLNTAATIAAEGQYGFTTREGAYGDLLFTLERLGAHLINRAHDPPLPTFDDPSVVAALEQYAGLVRQAPLTPGTPSTQSGWPDASVVGDHPYGVVDGNVAMWIDYITYHAAAPPLPFETGVAPLPARKQASTEFVVHALFISAHAAAPQACWDWIAYLSGRPELVTALPPRRSVASSPDWQTQAGDAALPGYRATLAYGDTSIFRQRWEIPWIAYTYPWLDAAFQATVAGQDARAALATAQAQAERLIACLETASSSADRERLRECARQVDPNYP